MGRRNVDERADDDDADDERIAARDAAAVVIDVDDTIGRRLVRSTSDVVALRASNRPSVGPSTDAPGVAGERVDAKLWSTRRARTVPGCSRRTPAVDAVRGCV
jgi:hypothetical protein